MMMACDKTSHVPKKMKQKDIEKMTSGYIQGALVIIILCREIADFMPRDVLTAIASTNLYMFKTKSRDCVHTNLL